MVLTYIYTIRIKIVDIIVESVSLFDQMHEGLVVFSKKGDSGIDSNNDASEEMTNLDFANQPAVNLLSGLIQDSNQNKEMTHTSAVTNHAINPSLKLSDVNKNIFRRSMFSLNKSLTENDQENPINGVLGRNQEHQSSSQISLRTIIED